MLESALWPLLHVIPLLSPPDVLFKNYPCPFKIVSHEFTLQGDSHHKLILIWKSPLCCHTIVMAKLKHLSVWSEDRSLSLHRQLDRRETGGQAGSCIDMWGCLFVSLVTLSIRVGQAHQYSTVGHDDCQRREERDRLPPVVTEMRDAKYSCLKNKRQIGGPLAGAR